MGPSKNRQGGQIFFTLTTAKVVVLRSWTIIPMPLTVIAQVNELAPDQQNLLTFYNRSGWEIGDADTEAPTESHLETPGVVSNDVTIPGVEDDKITGVDLMDDQPTTSTKGPSNQNNLAISLPAAPEDTLATPSENPTWKMITLL